MFYKGGNWTGWRAGSRVVVKNMAEIAFHEFLPSMRIERFMWEHDHSAKNEFPRLLCSQVYPYNNSTQWDVYGGDKGNF